MNLFTLRECARATRGARIHGLTRELTSKTSAFLVNDFLHLDSRIQLDIFGLSRAIHCNGLAIPVVFRYAGMPIMYNSPNVARPQSKGKQTIGDLCKDFIAMIAKEKVAEEAATTEANALAVLAAKEMNATNGLATSTFLVCARMRPAFETELAEGGENFECVLKTTCTEEGAEEATVLLPKISLTGIPKIERSSFLFDHTFGPGATNDDIFAALGRPLVAKTFAGEVGVIFAYGQTGSGKTFTMSAIMDRVVTELFPSDGTAPRAVRFSYLEVLGSSVHDCLDASKLADVQIGEALDGRVLTRNLSSHDVDSAAALERLIEVAKSRRATAPTERNAASSRSHGVGILTVAQPGFAIDDVEAPRAGVLMVIDLAGSERAADSMGHDKKRMDETKAVNLSLMALKDCIRARTLASIAAAGEKVFVPYRRTKLTLLMKDVFDISCSRLCSTVVLSCVSPLAKDAPHTLNTLGYAAPLRVAVRTAPAGPMERDERDPALWAHEKAVTWLSATAKAPMHDAVDVSDGDGYVGLAGFDAEAVIPGMSGLELCRMAEAELHLRIKKQVPGKEGAALGARVHAALWMLICDAKTRRRRPNGNLVTEEEEAEEARKTEEAAAKKNALWKEREASLAAGSTLDAAASMASRM